MSNANDQWPDRFKQAAEAWEQFKLAAFKGGCGCIIHTGDMSAMWCMADERWSFQVFNTHAFICAFPSCERRRHDVHYDCLEVEAFGCTFKTLIDRQDFAKCNDTPHTEPATS